MNWLHNLYDKIADAIGSWYYCNILKRNQQKDLAERNLNRWLDLEEERIAKAQLDAIREELFKTKKDLK